MTQCQKKGSLHLGSLARSSRRLIRIGMYVRMLVNYKIGDLTVLNRYRFENAMKMRKNVERVVKLIFRL